MYILTIFQYSSNICVDVLEFLQHAASCLPHVAAVSLYVGDQLYHFSGLALYLMHHAVHFQRVHTQQTHSVAENVQIVLVVGLTLVHKPDLQLLLPLVAAVINRCFESIVVPRISIRIFIDVKVVGLNLLRTFDFHLWSIFRNRVNRLIIQLANEVLELH